MTEAFALAHANIALAKYWGKADTALNLPAVPSLSLTLDALTTYTRVRFDPALAADEALLDGKVATGRPLARISRLLDRVRARAGLDQRARVESENDFPTSAGLASSASGFAALALAAWQAAGLPPDLEQCSDLARASSASAARSLYGGWVSLGAAALCAERVAAPDHLPVRMLVAVTTLGEKEVGSTEGMQHTKQTSPYYPSWVSHAPVLFEEIRSAVINADVATLGAAMEQSALMMHASMLAARPAIRYFAPDTLAVMDAVVALRKSGTEAYYTMDAGPHVKVLCRTESAVAVARALGGVPGVARVIHCAPGPDARLMSAEEWQAARTAAP
jgi:diphosphomevalonate decarboxylase